MNIIHYNLDDYFITRDAYHKAQGYFALCRKGNDVDFRTPYWNKSNRSKILSNWLSILHSHKKDLNLVPGLYSFELDLASKVGPLSFMKPLKERWEDITNYYDMIKPKSQPINTTAIDTFVSQCSRIRNITPFTVDQTLAAMQLSKSSGIPYFTKKNRVIYETKKILYNGKLYVAILGWRGQEGGIEPDDVKQRVVWMFPFALSILELQVYTPLIQAWQLFNVNSAYISIEAVQNKITKCFDTKDQDDYVICTDFSKFDQHFNHNLQIAAFKCIQSFLSYNSLNARWLKDIFWEKYEIPLAIDEDRMVSGKHGMGSGSGGTNFDECCAHSCLQIECAQNYQQELNPYSNAYGDDGYLTFKGIDPDKVIESYTSHGLEMNPDKQFVSKDSAVYLRRFFSTKYRNDKGIMLGIYSTSRALGRLMGQERYYNDSDSVDYAKYLTLRAWSIIENCSNHPLFDEFVEFVIKGDRYRLGLDIPGFIEGFDKDFDKLRTYDPNFLGFMQSQMLEQKGVRQWRIWQYLNSKI